MQAQEEFLHYVEQVFLKGKARVGVDGELLAFVDEHNQEMLAVSPKSYIHTSLTKAKLMDACVNTALSTPAMKKIGIKAWEQWRAGKEAFFRDFANREVEIQEKTRVLMEMDREGW